MTKITMSSPTVAKAAPKDRLLTSKPAATSSEIAIGRRNKQLELAEMLLRDEGATLDQMASATGWLPHTTRSALTGLKKKGFVISSDKLEGIRTYRAVAPE